MQLTTERLTIRPFTDADEASMIRLLRNTDRKSVV